MVKLGFKTQQSGSEAHAPFNMSVKDASIVQASSFISILNSTEVQGRTPDWNRDSQGILSRAGEPAAAALWEPWETEMGQPQLLSTDPCTSARGKSQTPPTPFPCLP